MRIAIPLADAAGTLAEEFSPASAFAIYDVHDDTRAVAYLGRQTITDPAGGSCATTPGFLRTQGVEIVMAHAISQNAINHLLEVGILAIKDAPLLASDALIAHLVSGTLQATPPEAAMHGGGCGGGGGCGSCCGGGGHGHGTPDTCGEHHGH